MCSARLPSHGPAEARARLLLCRTHSAPSGKPFLCYFVLRTQEPPAPRNRNCHLCSDSSTHKNVPCTVSLAYPSHSPCGRAAPQVGREVYRRWNILAKAPSVEVGLRVPVSLLLCCLESRCHPLRSPRPDHGLQGSLTASSWARLVILGDALWNGWGVSGAQLRVEFLRTPCERGKGLVGSFWPSPESHSAPAWPWLLGRRRAGDSPRGRCRWWLMERCQKQDFVRRGAGMPKSPGPPTCSYLWGRASAATSRSEDLLVSTVPAASPEESTGSAYLPWDDSPIHLPALSPRPAALQFPGLADH